VLFELFTKNRADEELLISACLVAGIGIFLGLVGMWLGLSAFRCHEYGVWKKTPLGARWLRYDEMGRFQYTAVKHYHHGAYMGTQITMRFVPQAKGAKTFKYSTRTKGDDDDLERLRDSVSQTLALRMADKFSAGEIVSWTKNMEFTPDGIRYRAIGFVVRKAAEVLRWEDYLRWEMSRGTIRLFARGLKKAVMTEQASAENFWPGLYFLQRLIQQERQGETLAEADVS